MDELLNKLWRELEEEALAQLIDIENQLLDTDYEGDDNE